MIHVHKDEDVEMIDAKVEESDKGDEDIIDAAKEEAEKTLEAKDDTKKTEIPPSSSSLSVSLGFGDQFLRLSSDSSLSYVQNLSDSYIDTIVGDVFLTGLQKTDTADLIKMATEAKFLLSSLLTRQSLEEYDEMRSFTIHAFKQTTVKDHRRRKHDDDEDDDDEDPPAGPNQGKKTKRRRTKESESSKKPSSTKETPKDKALTKRSKTGKSASAKEPVEEPNAEVVMDDTSDDVQPPRPPTPDPEWNKQQVILDQPEQPWFNQMVSDSKDPLTFNGLMATPIDFYKYMLNGLKIDNLTQDILLGPAFNLLKGTCSSSIELEYNFQECFNALIDKLDWNNPEGDRYPFNLSKPLPLYSPQVIKPLLLITSSTMIWEYFEYFDPKSYHQAYAYDKDALLGISTAHEDVNCFIGSDSEGNFVDLHLNDIEDMLLLVVQQQSYYSRRSDIVALLWFWYSFTTKHNLKQTFVEDLQLGVESYQKKLNITKPQKTFPGIEFKEPYTPLYDPPRIVYEDLNKQKKVLRANELYKFSDGTLKSVRDEIHHRVLDFRLDYNKEMPKRKWKVVDRRRSSLMIELIDKHLREREIIRNLKRLVSARELKMDYKLMTPHPEISRRVFPKMELSDSSNHTTVADWVYYVLFEIVYHTLSALFFLLSTAAIIFTVARFHPDVTNMSAIYQEALTPQVHYSIAKFALCTALERAFRMCVWQLASVVTVLENVKGFKAISKSNKLLNGKKKVEVAIAFAMYVVLSALIIAWELFVQHGDEIFSPEGVASPHNQVGSSPEGNGTLPFTHAGGNPYRPRQDSNMRPCLGGKTSIPLDQMPVGLVLMMWLLKFITIHTILYLVCKSVHGEAIDKLSLSTFLEEYTLETAVLPISGEEIGRTRASV
ncbi:hypothetical protein Tco_0250662 [Tanacetum coccineum]